MGSGSFDHIKSLCTPCMYSVIFVLGVFTISLTFVLIILHNTSKDTGSTHTRYKHGMEKTQSGTMDFHKQIQGFREHVNQNNYPSVYTQLQKSKANHTQEPDYHTHETHLSYQPNGYWQHMSKHQEDWSVVGKVTDNNQRTFILFSRKHPTRRHRYIYQAKSTDLYSQTTFALSRGGIDITSERDLGSNELNTNDIVFLPEINTNANVFITHNIF